MGKDVLAILDIPPSVQQYISHLSKEDKEAMVFTLFWTMVDIFENFDLADGTFENFCGSQFSQWGHDYFLNQIDEGSKEGQKEFDRMFDVFAEFNIRLDRSNAWRRIGMGFYKALSHYNLIGEEKFYEVEVDSRRNSILITVSE